MCARRLVLCCAVLGALSTTSARGAVTFTTTHAAGSHDFDAMMSSTDLIQGLIATELPGDRGWYSANTAAADRLPAFTDGAGVLGSNLTGLLYDIDPPGEPAAVGLPVKTIQYDLGAPKNIEEISVFTGNNNNADGRILSTTVIRYSTNNGNSFDLLGYFQSDPSGYVNDENLVDFGVPADKVTRVKIFEDASTTMISGVTNIQFDFYAVHNTLNELRDPFDGVNPFTGIDDALTGAFVSPLVWEIDVVGQAGAAPSADFDGDSKVDGRDFLIWQRGFGKPAPVLPADGDANRDQMVNGDDLAVWRGQFGGTGMIAAVPEPGTAAAAWIGAWLVLAGRRLRRH